MYTKSEQVLTKREHTQDILDLDSLLHGFTSRVSNSLMNHFAVKFPLKNRAQHFGFATERLIRCYLELDMKQSLQAFKLSYPLDFVWRAHSFDVKAATYGSKMTHTINASELIDWGRRLAKGEDTFIVSCVEYEPSYVSYERIIRFSQVKHILQRSVDGVSRFFYLSSVE